MKAAKIPLIDIRNNSVKVLSTIFILVFILSCNDEDELILDTTTLQGKWIEVEPEDLIQFAGENHTFTFTEDSFFLAIDSWTDVVIPGDSCEDCPSITYIKGEYSLELNQKIYFDGVRCLDSNYIHITPPEIPGYSIDYSYKLKSLNTIVLNPQSEYESITMIKE